MNKPKLSEESFDGFRSELVSTIGKYIDALDKEKGVNHCEKEIKRTFDKLPLTETCAGQVWVIARVYHGARTIINSKGVDIDIDPDRTIKIAIGATEDWTPVVVVMSSFRDAPIQIVAGTEAALKEAIRAVHGEIFHGWPLGKDEIDDLIRRHLPGEH